MCPDIQYLPELIPEIHFNLVFDSLFFSFFLSYSLSLSFCLSLCVCLSPALPPSFLSLPWLAAFGYGTRAIIPGFMPFVGLLSWPFTSLQGMSPAPEPLDQRPSSGAEIPCLTFFQPDFASLCPDHHHCRLRRDPHLFLNVALSARSSELLSPCL